MLDYVRFAARSSDGPDRVPDQYAQFCEQLADHCYNIRGGSFPVLMTGEELNKAIGSIISGTNPTDVVRQWGHVVAQRF